MLLVTVLQLRLETLTTTIVTAHLIVIQGAVEQPANMSVMTEKPVTQEHTVAIFLQVESLLVHVLQVKLKTVVVALPQQLLVVLGLAHQEVQLTNQQVFVQLQQPEQLLAIVVQILTAELHITIPGLLATVVELTLIVINTAVVAKLAGQLPITII